jgi:uncharacterized protein YjbI with pentapeptide repeats
MDLEIIKAEKGTARRTTPRAAKVDLEIILEQHRDWVKSKERTGRQADLSRLNLEGADLTDTNLRNALLSETVLKGADLLLTDLQGARLLQANLEGANLLGARLREANLQGATLEGATGLLAAELAGTNLTFAKLPAEVETAQDLKYISRRGRHAKWLSTAMLLLNALACWRILTISDAQVLRNAALLPFPLLRNNLPLVQFLLLCPVVIGAFYLWLHVYLQRFWEATAALPAIFENGRRLDQSLPWLMSWPARSYFKWLRARRSALAGVERAICIIALYWIAPTTMTLFWARYLTLQDLRGTILHAFLIAAAITGAIHFPRSAARAFRGDDSGLPSESRDPLQQALASADKALAEAPVAQDPPARVVAPILSASLTTGSLTAGPLTGATEAHPHRQLNKAARRKLGFPRMRIPIGAGIGLLLCFLSIGTIGGAPHGGNEAQGIVEGSPLTWAADALWLIGYDPYAQVAEAEISRKAAGWTGSDSEISHVQGASLNGLRLRYLQGYSAFLVKARLRQADLRYAYLSEADLRQANLRQANLRLAVLDRAKLNGAMMQSADLERANLVRAELGKADLSFACLAGALVLDAKLDGAVFYGADLRGAALEEASFEQADLRQANLEGANLRMSDLKEAYLSAAKLAGARLDQSQLGSAILIGADLRRTDLSDSNIQSAVLSGADFGGANLRNADLRGVVGSSASQLCAAADLRQTRLDDALATEVSAQCSAKR